MATQSSTLYRKIPWTESPVGHCPCRYESPARLSAPTEEMEAEWRVEDGANPVPAQLAHRKEMMEAEWRVRMELISPGTTAWS